MFPKCATVETSYTRFAKPSLCAPILASADPLCLGQAVRLLVDARALYGTITCAHYKQTTNSYGPLLPAIPLGSVHPTDKRIYEAALAFLVSKSLSWSNIGSSRQNIVIPFGQFVRMNQA